MTRLIYEGGDNYQNPDAPPKAQTKDEKKLSKYGGDVDGYSVKNTVPGIGDGSVVQERKVTDIFCLGIFIAFLVAMLTCTSLGFKYGDVDKYLAPIDSNLLICGHPTKKSHTDTTYNKEAVGYPYLYFTNLAEKDVFNNGWCVSECPKTQTSALKFAPVAGKSTPDVAGGQYGTIKVMNYCIPNPKELSEAQMVGYNALKSALLNNAAGRNIQDLYKSSRAIFISMAMSIVYCVAFIYLMSSFAEQIAWGIVAITQLGLFAGSGICLLEYFETKGGSGVTAEKSKGFLIAGIVLLLSAFIMLCMLVCGFNQLRIAINVVDASADFTKKTKRIIGVPVFYFFIQMVVFITWLFSMACIWSWGEIIPESATLQSKETYFPAGHKWDFYGVALFMIFGLFWILEFMQAKTYFITMVAASTYYFDSHKERDGEANVSLGFKYAYMNHAGSLAFGSFIVALVQFIRAVFMTLAE